MRSPRLGTMALLVLAAGCRKDEELPIVEATSAPAESVPPPIDHLKPGELMEGTERAFEIVLPRGSRVDGRFTDVIYVSIDAPQADVSNYLRSRVRDGKVILGASGTVFDRVRVPTAPDTYLAIWVRPSPNRPDSAAVIELRDVTPPKAAALPDEDSRWKAAGLKSGGGILDPTHLQ